MTDTYKAPRDHRPDSCLHCTMMTSIEEWFDRYGERRNGQVIVDVTLVIGKLAECVVEITEATADRSSRRRAVRFAHDAIDAALKSHRTGKLVPVDIQTEN